MPTKSDELKRRTKTFAVEVVKFIGMLSQTRETDVMARQLLRAATSVGANDRAACRARSQADFISKIGIVEEEADESAYWLELLLDTNKSDGRALRRLLDEANELTAIFTASGRTAKQRIRQ